MPRVLIVTSMFLPYLAADTHRARLLAAELPGLGWEVEILTPGEGFQLAEHLEPRAHELAVGVPVHAAVPEWSALFRLLRSRTLGWRAYRPLARLGDALLARKRFDLVYFSCSQPALFPLGVRWRRRYGVSFVLDLHDPWYTPKLEAASHLPGWKRRAANRLAGFLERATLRRAAGLVAVSPAYLETLNERYRGSSWPALDPARQAAIPFGASERDLHAARELPPSPFGSQDGEARTVVYTGAGGPIMEDSFREVCRQLAAARAGAPDRTLRLKVELFGTEPSATARQPVLTRVAVEEGVSDLVVEHPARWSYLEALRRVIDADGLLVLGVRDAAYSPSKLALYALSGKPILACMAQGSIVDRFFATQPELGWVTHFGLGSKGAHGKGPEPMEGFLRAVAERRIADRRRRLEGWMAPAMARQHVDLFAACLRPSS